MRGYVYQRARFERGPRHSGYLSGEIENRETNGNKSKLLRASLQACFACNCSNLRKHSLFLFLFFSSLHFANLIMIIIIGTITWSMFFVQFLFFCYLFSPNTCLFVLFVYTFVAYLKVRYGTYLHTYISQVYPYPPPPLPFSTLLSYPILPTR